MGGEVDLRSVCQGSLLLFPPRDSEIILAHLKSEHSIDTSTTFFLSCLANFAQNAGLEELFYFGIFVGFECISFNWFYIFVSLVLMYCAT